MDALIAQFESTPDCDLIICPTNGVAYQRDMAADRVAYGDDYLAKVDAYDGTEIAQRVNVGRCAMLSRYLMKGARVLDVGAGSGAFVRDARACGFDAGGFDVIPAAINRLSQCGWLQTNPAQADAVTMWDVIEHMEAPSAILTAIKSHALLFVSVPLFKSLDVIRVSKHYRPGEHLYYWTMKGFVGWLWLYGFALREFSMHEVEAGREEIGAFAFKKFPIMEETGRERCRSRFNQMTFSKEPYGAGR